MTLGRLFGFLSSAERLNKASVFDFNVLSQNFFINII